MRPSLGTTLSTGACARADVQAVWDAYATPSQWSTWSPQVRGVRCGRPDGPVAVGERGEVLGPAGMRVPFEVTASDAEQHRWAWRVRAGVVVLDMCHGVHLLDDGRCCVWVRISGPAPVVVGYLPLARLALHRLVQVRA